jgi:hypothetical protein
MRANVIILVLPELSQTYSMAITIKLRPSPVLNVRLIPSNEKDFDLLLKSANPRSVSNLSCLKPFLVIIVNNDPRTIVAYSVHFSMTDTAGRLTRKLAQFLYPGALAWSPLGCLPRGREVWYQEQRVVNPEFEIDLSSNKEWRFSDWATAQATQFRSTQILELGLDSLIFEDGELIGPDTSGLAGHFATYCDARQIVYKQFQEDVQAGSVDQAFQGIERLRKRMIALRTSSLDRNEFNPYIWSAIEDMYTLRGNLGEKVTEAIHQLRQHSQFAIRDVRANPVLHKHPTGCSTYPAVER